MILDADRAAEALAEIEGVVPVTQKLQPRLLLIRAAPRDRRAIQRIPGVVGIFETAPTDPLPGLSPPERVFVDAWATRSAPKIRRGEGLHWDAPGFEPPDVPRGAPTPMESRTSPND